MRPPKEGEVLLTSPDEMWLRPTFPGAVSDRGEVGWEAFKLRSDDNGELSGVRSSICGPEEAETARLRRAKADGREPKTGGTWGITVAQLDVLALQCFDDTKDPTKAEKQLPKGHAVLDMVGLKKEEAYDRYVELAEAANENGRLCLVDPSTI